MKRSHVLVLVLGISCVALAWDRGWDWLNAGAVILAATAIGIEWKRDRERTSVHSCGEMRRSATYELHLLSCSG